MGGPADWVSLDAEQCAGLGAGGQFRAIALSMRTGQGQGSRCDLLAI